VFKVVFFNSALAPALIFSHFQNEKQDISLLWPYTGHEPN